MATERDSARLSVPARERERERHASYRPERGTRPTALTQDEARPSEAAAASHGGASWRGPGPSRRAARAVLQRGRHPHEVRRPLVALPHARARGAARRAAATLLLLLAAAARRAMRVSGAARRRERAEGVARLAAEGRHRDGRPRRALEGADIRPAGAPLGALRVDEPALAPVEERVERGLVRVEGDARA
jgi:hypothetical protein